MIDIVNVWAFLLAAMLMIVAPGPGTFYVIGKAHQSPRHGSHAILGIVAGDVALITISGLGFASLMVRWPLILLAVKVLGAIYLCYLGWDLMAGVQQQEPQIALRENQPTDTRQSFLKGLLITLVNPKAVLFFAAFFPLFIRIGATSTMHSFYVLGAIFELLNLTYFVVVILAVMRMRQRPIFDRFLKGGFDKLSGIALTGCGLLILVNELFRHW